REVVVLAALDGPVEDYAARVEVPAVEAGERRHPAERTHEQLPVDPEQPERIDEAAPDFDCSSTGRDQVEAVALVVGETGRGRPKPAARVERERRNVAGTLRFNGWPPGCAAAASGERDGERGEGGGVAEGA